MYLLFLKIPHMAAAEHGVEFPVLYSRPLLVINFKYSSEDTHIFKENFPGVLCVLLTEDALCDGCPLQGASQSFQPLL